MTDRHTYKLEGTRDQIAADLRCTVADLSSALPNLKASGIGDVTLGSNGYVTLKSRRLEREFLDRENSRKRVADHRLKHKCNGQSNVKVPLVSGSGSSGSGSLEGGPGETIETLRRELCEYFGKPAAERWHYEAEYYLAEVCKSPTVIHEWHTIKSYYSKTGAYKRSNLASLLQHWISEVEKARKHEPNGPESNQRKENLNVKML